MNGFIELVFEKVPDEAVDQLVNALLCDVVISEISHSELGSSHTPTEIEGQYFHLLMATPGPACVNVKAVEMSIGGVTLHCPLIRILRYDELNEIAIIFNDASVFSDAKDKVILRMENSVRTLAQKLGIAEFYCGFEPATDKKTRFFSQDKIGPLTNI